jgi:hypothetical protein
LQGKVRRTRAAEGKRLPAEAAVLVYFRASAPARRPALRAVYPATGFDGALKPHDCLVDPVVIARRIRLGFLTTDLSLGYALLALIHHVAGRLGSSQATVTALSMTWR